MKLTKYFELSALICGLAAILNFVFYLLLDYKSCSIFFEPNHYIKIIEIIWGLLSLPFLIKLICKNFQNEHK